MISRGLRDRRYFSKVGERLGFLPHSYKRTVPGAIWLHAVSVGEILSAMELIKRLRASVPGASIYVSTTTLAGRSTANEKLQGMVDGVFYIPFDYVSCVRRVVRAIRPSILVIMETEIWPNLFREVKRSGAGLLIINGRISDRAIGRYKSQCWFFQAVLAHADSILVQSERDRLRYIEAGAPETIVRVGGNLKYDFEPKEARVPEAVSSLLDRIVPAEVWIAASTAAPVESGDPDEDNEVLKAFQELARTHGRLLLMLAPRNPERFEVVAKKLAGISHARRSQLTAATELKLPGVLLVNTIGELGSLFALANVVFMGGTLPKRGGHNILEPAFFGRPVIAGPNMQNFADMAQEFTDAGALLRIADSQGLAQSVDELLRDQARSAEIGARGLALAASKRGATQRALEEIRRVHAEAVPHFVHSSPGWLFRSPLARIWRAGSAVKQRRLLWQFRRLSTPVISIGGISMGGSGKTPFVLWLAERLKEHGERPAILTRGYRRKSPERITVIETGRTVPTAVTGDEAQIFVRAALGPVGIGADRFEVGSAVEQEFKPSVFLLDDGFQHTSLSRDLDIVLIDSLDPFSGGDVFPMGGLRESPHALRRANALVLTRTEPGRDYTGLERRLCECNPNAPLYHARVKPVSWNCDSRQWPAEDLPFRKVAAFCGLASPATFWRTLARLGYEPVFQFAFGDHHTYRPMELQRLLSQAREMGAEALLTTEKDFMNLPEEADQLVAPLPLCWLRIGVEVVEADALLSQALRASSPSKRIL